MTLLFFWVFIAAMALGVPIVFALGFAPVVGFLATDKLIFMNMIVQRSFAGINQFPLLAIPFFILAGEVMNQGGITIRLVHFANAVVGHLRGGLAHVNVVTSMLFAGLSGSAVADTSAIGSLLIPAMEKAGYSRKFAAAITAASSVIGPIIPPSIIMVIYAFMMNVSVAGSVRRGSCAWAHRRLFADGRDGGHLQEAQLPESGTARDLARIRCCDARCHFALAHTGHHSRRHPGWGVSHPPKRHRLLPDTRSSSVCLC